MCRFVAHLSKKSRLLAEILTHQPYSLIRQSRHAREGNYMLNADGFGIAWYTRAITPESALYKSILPIWNDANLCSLVNHTTSKCFISHIRAATAGGIGLVNCHPFVQGRFSFAHNGDLGSFAKIKQPLIEQLPNEYFLNIKGQTDSEYFFALVLSLLGDEPSPGVNKQLEAIKQAIRIVIKLQQQANVEPSLMLNVTFSDGEHLIATRFKLLASHQDALSLYFTDKYQAEDNPGVTIASEPLDDEQDKWQEVPENHFIIMNKNFNLVLEPIELFDA